MEDDPKTYALGLLVVLWWSVRKVNQQTNFEPVYVQYKQMSNQTKRETNADEVLLVYTTCKGFGRRSHFAVWKSPVPTKEVPCNQTTRFIDCNEAVPILNFIIDNYERPLARRYIFTHGHEYAWHFTGNLFRALKILMQTSYWKTQKYGGLFQNWWRDKACGPGEAWSDPLYHYVFSNTSMPSEPVDDNNQRPCCATWWMDSDLVHSRTKSEYITIRDRLRQWSMEHMTARPNPAYYCGRTMEYTWHILFSKSAYVEACKECV